MYWIERLEQVDEDDPDSEQIWVLYAITCDKKNCTHIHAIRRLSSNKESGLTATYLFHAS